MEVITTFCLFSFLQECCLCSLRGGALKPTTDGKWAHIICALTISEAVFEDPRKREPINVMRIPLARRKLVSWAIIGHYGLGVLFLLLFPDFLSGHSKFEIHFSLFQIIILTFYSISLPILIILDTAFPYG